MNEKDPFEFLMNIGSSKEAVFLVGTPVFILAFIAIVYTILVIIKRRREKSKLEAAMESEQ